MADKVISDALKLDDSVYTRKPFTLSSDSSVTDTKYKTMSDVVRSAKIDDSWKTPTIESIGNLKKGYDATQIEEFATTFGVGGLARLGQTALGNIINAVEDPTRFAGSAIGAGIGATAGLKLAGKAALGKVGGWLARALASTTGALAGGALGGATVSALTPTPAGDEDELEKFSPRYRWKNAIEAYNKGEISAEEYEKARNEYILFQGRGNDFAKYRAMQEELDDLYKQTEILPGLPVGEEKMARIRTEIEAKQKEISDYEEQQKAKYQALIDKYGKEYKKYARNRDIIIDTIKGRQYPVSNVADYVVQSAAQGIENIEEWKQNIYNNAGIDQSSIGSQAGEAIGSIAEFIGLAWLGKKGFGRSKAKQIEGVYSAKTGKPKVVTTTPARKEVEQKVENLLKAYSFGEMSGQYTAQNVLDYADKTGDVNFENLDITDRQTAMAASYGVMGTLVEFMGGIEPVLAGAVRKLGAKTPVLRAGLRVATEEGAEEFVQGLQEFLVRKIDNTSDKTFGDALKEGLQAAAWGAVLGGPIGSITYSKNRSNIVKSLRKNFPQMTEPEATKIANNMIESVTDNLSPEHKALFDDLRAKVAYMYEDADLDEAEKADAIDSTARLEFALASNYATENGIDVSEVPIFGETNEIGWFRAGITPEQRVEIDRYLSEVSELKQQQTETQDQLNKADKTNTALITELGEKLDNINAKLEVLQSDEYRIRQLRTRATARISQNMRANLANKREDLQTALEASGLKLGLRKPRYVSDHGSLYFTVLAGKNGQAQINIRVSDTPFTDKKKKIHLALNTNVTPAEFVSAVQSLVEQANNAENITEFLKQQVQNTIDKQPRTGRVYFQEQFDLANENARLDEIYPEYKGETINIEGKERSVYNSNGDRIAKSEQALRNFYNWFGDSKVVDEQDRPLVVYHGTKAQFDTFETTTIGKSSGNAGFYGTGFYFTNKQDEAQIYAETAYIGDVPLSTFSGMTYEQAQALMKKNAVVMPLYLKSENPFMWDNIKTKAEADRISKQIGMPLSWNKTYKEINRFSDDSKSMLFSEKLKELGYDGVIKGIEFVAFEPNQIKSVDNRGTYSSDTGNIYFQSAYAGSAVDYDRPSLEAIGSGEGNQAHGWGLYYALNPEIAENYMAKLFGAKNSNLSLDQEFELLKVNGKPILNVYDIETDRALLDLLTWKPYGVVEAELEKRISKWEQLSKDPDYKFKDYANKKIEAYKKLKTDLFNNGMSLIKKDQGQVHEVDIPEMDVLLDEQKMLIDQSEFVQKKIWEINDKLNLGIKDSGIRGSLIYYKIAEKANPNGYSEKAASQLLDKYGIKGITYFGQQDGRCFVIFNENSVKVLRKKFDELGNMLFQSSQSGKRGAYMPAIRLILRSQKMDVSTLSHELAHDWFEIYTSHYRSGDASKEFMRSWGLVEKAFGIEDGNPTTIRNASEAFARAYEAWVVNKQDWDKNVALSAPERDEVIKTFQRYQNYLRDIYGTMTNKYFMETWGKVGELKPELKQWFDRMTAVSETETPKTTAETVLEAVERSNLTDEEKQDVRRAVALNTPERYEVEGGNKNALQNRLSILARDIDQNNMILKKNYDTRRDMLAVAKAADEFVRTRQDEALDIINGNKSEVEGLFKEDLYTALERLAVENNDLELLQTLSESQVANGLAKELGQRVAGFRNFLANSDVDIVSTYNNLQKKYNNAIKPRGQQQINESADLFVELVAEEDVKSMQELDSILKDMECK